MAIAVINPSEKTDSISDVANLLIALAVIVVLVLGALYLLLRIADRGAAQPGASTSVTLPAGTGQTPTPEQ